MGQKRLCINKKIGDGPKILTMGQKDEPWSKKIGYKKKIIHHVEETLAMKTKKKMLMANEIGHGQKKNGFVILAIDKIYWP